MPRITLRAVSLAALALTAAGVLTGCGDDSTATSTPTSLASSTTAPLSSSAPDSAAAEATGTNGDASGPVQTPGQAATAPPETPEAMPSDFPGPDAAPMGEREQAYVDEVKSEGVEVSGNGESAVVIANYVCAAQQAGEPAETIAINVNAMAGVEQSMTGSSMSPEEAGQIYIDVAKSSYCP